MMKTTFSWYAEDENAMRHFGEKLAKNLRPGALVYLTGDLGSGKTTLCRAMLRGLGYLGSVKSPTYTLVEPYDIAGQRVYHFDLYRLSDLSELEYMGCRDYFDNESICLVEWPEYGAGFLPNPSLKIHIRNQAQGRILELVSEGALADTIIEHLINHL